MSDVLTDERVDELVELVPDGEAAASLLSDEEREAYFDTQQSIVDARRSAETHEGSLQLH